MIDKGPARGKVEKYRGQKMHTKHDRPGQISNVLLRPCVRCNDEHSIIGPE